MATAGCTTTDHDRYDAYALTVREMLGKMQETQRQRLTTQQAYLTNNADTPFVVVEFDATGRNIHQIRINNSILLNQLAMAGGDGAFQMFAFANVLRELGRPQPYWYETAIDNITRNIVGLAGIAGGVYLGGKAWDTVGDMAVTPTTSTDRSTSTAINYNSNNRTEGGSTAISNHNETSTGVQQGGSTGPGDGLRNTGTFQDTSTVTPMVAP